MAVAPLGAGRSLDAASSQAPNSRITLAKWMPAVACSGSGKWMALAALGLGVRWLLGGRQA
jgi:hypothetical protein